MKEEIKQELREELNKRKHLLRLFESWLDTISEEKLSNLENVLHSLLGHFPDNTASIINEHLKDDEIQN